MSPTALIVLCAALPLGDAEFVRGDANSDGKVSISDGHFILSYLFRGFQEPECMDAADWDDKQKINIADAIRLIDFTVAAGPEPPPPFGSPGTDPTEDALDCGAYGNGDPLEDPEAALEVIEAESAGEEGRARIRIAVSTSTAIGGYAGRMRLPPDVAIGVEEAPRDLSGTLDAGYKRAVLQEDIIQFGFLTSIVETSSMPAGRSVEALELTVCLRESLPPGEYPLVLETGELIDFESGRAIHPRLVSSTLSVTATVPAGPECNPPDPPPPERIPVNAVFKLGDVVAPPGGSVSVPFIIRADQDIQAYVYSVDFDETLLDAISMEPVWRRSEGDPEYGFSVFHMNNDDRVPGSAGVDEGYMLGAVVFSLTEPVAMPRNTDNIAMLFHMDVAPDAPDGTTEIQFLDGGRDPRAAHPHENYITATGREVHPSLAESFLLIDCILQILPDGALFVRGDSNRDGLVNVSDPVNTLGHLFLGAGPLDCSDAADADDGGSVEMADIILTLEHLFLGGPPLPPPYASEGLDPTPDGLACFLRP